ncbi:hypothetical protein [Micromonospora craterilacus]|uniref:hypothetical protein n=1 Tax=Micromonospora craterilacus TaxID=1655439 RepID=UPI0018F343FE|nr:hypothetical protein [Micromonospora craterilacus]
MTAMREAEEDMIKLGLAPDLAAMNVRFMRWISRRYGHAGSREVVKPSERSSGGRAFRPAYA